MQKMSEHINLTKVIAFLQENAPNMKYEEFEETFQTKIKHEAISVQVLKSA